jgi:branched-chain amino acid transport system ATP-binding protein
MRGLISAMLGVEGVRKAQERYGKGKVMTGEQVRWGLENLNLDQKTLDAMGFAGVMRPVQTSCLDHMGSSWVRVHTWNGSKWEFTSDWYQADEKVLRPMVMLASASMPTRRSSSRVRPRNARSSQGRPARAGRFPALPRAGGHCQQERRDAMSNANILLRVNSIEVIYNHVILVLKGVSFSVPEGGIVALLGGNGAGKTTTLRAVSNLLHGERGEVTKGTIDLRDERIEALTPAELVKRGVIQVMEGRHCFAHLSIEENLLTGAYTRRDGKAAIAQTLDKVYNYFPRLKTRRSSQAAYTSGGEQQMCAIGRALMASPRMVLLDEPSMGLAPQIVDEVFAIVKDLNQKEGVTFLLAEQNTNMALRYADFGYILENGRVVMEGAAGIWRPTKTSRSSTSAVLGRAQELPRRQALSPPQALAVLRPGGRRGVICWKSFAPAPVIRLPTARSARWW